MRHTIFALLLPFFLATFFFSCRSVPVEIDREPGDELFPDSTDMEAVEFPPLGDDLPVSAFGEIWAYVVAGREAALIPGLPITDIAYFGAEIDSYGSLTDVPNRGKLPPFAGRVHLVVACNARSLSHFVLVPGSNERTALVAALLSAVKDYDGLQIDFELVPQRDGSAFLSFLEELRKGLSNKLFTIALPARNRKIGSDVYDYEKIVPLVDRVLVMAYDEHWAASAAGPIASLSWCKRVAEYSLGVIGREKLIMGIPFYGRAWGSGNPSRALVYSGVEDIIKENRVKEIRRENGIPVFDYETTVSVRVYYEDDYSLATRMNMYRSMGVAAVGFWRLGQETQAVWKLIALDL